jgi:hypothetical protein
MYQLIQSLELKTPFEVLSHLMLLSRLSFILSIQRALNQTKWKEYFSGGRKYYYNVSPTLSLFGILFDNFFQTESKESKWDMPDELLLLLEKVEKEGQPAPNA